MPVFNYEARDRHGQATHGSIHAEDADHLRRLLRSNELYLIRHRAGREALTHPAKGRDGQKPQPVSLFAVVRLQDMVIATRQMATLIRSGVPMVQSMEIVGSQSSKPQLQQAFREMKSLVSEGQSLSAGMRKHPKIFNQLVIALTEAGETAGTLDQTLEVAAEQMDREDELRRNVKAAMLYPKIVIAAAAGVVAMMLYMVVPVFAGVYKGLHAELPAMTLSLIAVSDFCVHSWWIMLIALIAIALAFRWYRSTPGGRRRLDIIVLGIPVIGPVLRKIAIARFVQTLAGALKGGVPVLTSMTISAQTAGNSVIREAVMSAAVSVRDGSTIGTELDRTGQFPLMVTRMVAAGEHSGNVDDMLDEINRFYDRDVRHSVEAMTRLMEPILTGVVGGIVLYVLLSLYMPVFKLGEAFSKAK